MEEIISVDNNVTFKPIPNKLEVTIVFDDNQQTVALYDNLSESEIKRFSLVVLRALIKYGKYDTLILDDPIDSYDDYYTLVACEYIKNIVTESKLTNWYILTNDFMALSNISAIIRCDCIIYYYIPDDIFTENSFRIDNFVSNYREIEKATQSELQLLRDFLKGTLNADEKLSYISLIVTLRNFKSLILKNYDKLLIKEGKKIANSVARYDTDEKFNDDISLVVEHYYMHYDEKINPDLKINSNTIEVKKIINLYNRICKSKSRLLANYGKDNSSLCDMRELVAKTPFGLFDGSKIINLIFCKICIVSYLKYEFEKQLITKLKGKYKFSNDDIDKICRTNALGKKIEKAKELSFLNSYNAESYLNDYKSVLEKNKLLINLFGHALNQMFPPYIATNVKDIKKFKKEIDRLDKSH